jgi:hypothetical protein
MAELMRDAGEGLGHRHADALLTVGDRAGDRHRRGPAYLVDQARQILGGGRQEALGQEDLAGEAVAQDPEDLVADVGLQAVDGQDHATLRAEQRPEPLGIGRGQGPQLIVAVQQVGDGARGHDDPAAGQLAVDLGDAAVLGIAESADQGHDVEAELVIGQGEVGLGLGPIGPEEAGASGVGTAPDRQGEPEDAIEGGDGAMVIVVGIGPVLAFGAIEKDGGQGQGAIGLRSRALSFAHGWISPEGSFSPFYAPGRLSSHFCHPRKKGGKAPRITLPAIRRALQRLLSPRARPDCPHCHPCAHLYNQQMEILTE